MNIKKKNVLRTGLILLTIIAIMFSILSIMLITKKATLVFEITEYKETPAEQTEYVITNKLKEQLKLNWQKSQPYEYHACIKGRLTPITKINSDEYYKLQIVLEETTSYTKGGTNMVEHPYCEEFATLHSHPEIGCNNILNKGDVINAKEHFKKGASLYLIQCEENKIEIYDRSNMWKGEVIII